MADRMHPYPVDMFPQNLMPNSLQQSQISQQLPQSQLPDQMVSALFNPEHSQPQKLHYPQQSGDLVASPMNHQQSGLGAQHAPNQPTIVDMFASLSIQPSQDQVHDSPHPAAQPVGPPGINQKMEPRSQQQQKRMMTPVEFQERRNYLLSLISQSEGNMASLLQDARNASSVDPHMLQNISQRRTELANRKDVYAKFVAIFGPVVTQQMVNDIPPHINPMAHSTSQQPQQATVSNPQVQPGFITQPNQCQGALNQQIPIQPTQIGLPNTIPPQTGGTPHQISGGQIPNVVSLNLGNFAVQGGHKVPDQTQRSVGIVPLDKQRFESTYACFCRALNTSPGSRVLIGDRRTVDLHQLHVCVMHEGGAASVTQRDRWAVIGGRLGFIQFPGDDSEPARCGPGIAQELQNTYDQYLRHFESAYILAAKNRPPTGSPQQPIHQMHPNPLAIGNNATPGMSGNPTEVPPNPQRQFPDQQFIAAALRYVGTSAQDMRAQRVHDQLINFVERHRTELMKVYQQVELIAKRDAKQEQLNMANAQGPFPNMHEQASIGLQPGVQRPPHPIGANTMVSTAGEVKMANESFMPESVAAVLHEQPPTQDQIQHAIMAIGQLKHAFQQRLPGMAAQQIADEQRQEYNQILEQVYKMSSELDQKLHVYFAVFRNDDLLRRYVAIVLTVARQWQLLSTSSPQYIISLSTLRGMRLQIDKLNEEFERRWRAMKPVAPAVNSQPHTSLTPACVHPASPLSVPPMQDISQIQSNGRPATLSF